MADKPEHSLDKLPRWARWEIERLRKTVESLGGWIAGVEKSTSGVSWSYDRVKYQHLPAGSLIRFALCIPFGCGQMVPGDFDVCAVDFDDGGLGNTALEISASDGGLIVEPRAANVVIIRGKKW